jgi:hypothetical protein
MTHPYFQPSHPGSFGGPNRLAVNTNSSVKKATMFLESEETYTRNKRVIHKFDRLKINTPHVDYLWQADLLDVSKFSRQNKGVKFLLTIIDTLSRFGFVRGLKNKKELTILNAFKDVLETSTRKCKYLQTDEGLEFRNKLFINFLELTGIVPFFNHSFLKAAMVERFNRTIFMRISKFFSWTKSKKYIDFLQDFVSSYNSSIHRIIKMRPKDVNIYNQTDVWFNSNSTLFKKVDNELVSVSPRKPKFKLADVCRVKVIKPTFSKGWTNTFSNELYTIREVIKSKPITYRINKYNGEDILGIFYEQELSKVKI